MFNQMLKEHKYWSDQVQLRDCYVCQSCGAIGICLHAHHLNEDPSRESDPGNGITLCASCHKMEHMRFEGKSSAEEIRGRSGKLPSRHRLLEIRRMVKSLNL